MINFIIIKDVMVYQVKKWIKQWSVFLLKRNFRTGTGPIERTRLFYLSFPTEAPHSLATQIRFYLCDAMVWRRPWLLGLEKLHDDPIAFVIQWEDIIVRKYRIIRSSSSIDVNWKINFKRKIFLFLINWDKNLFFTRNRKDRNQSET